MQLCLTYTLAQMHKTNRQLVVYLSKSLKIPEEVLQEVRQQLISCGFLINEFKKGTQYDRNLRAKADFVLVLPFLPTLEASPSKWWTNVGRGQFGEVKEACNEGQPAFVYMGYENGEILMTKCEEDAEDHWTSDSGDWKLNYGTIASFVIGKKPVPLYDFITGFFEMSRLIKHINPFREYPVTPEDAFFKPKRRLLL